MQALQHRQDIALHWFDPFGSTNIQDMCNVPPRDGAATRIIFWDQEPLRRDAISEFLQQFRDIYLGPITMITSELYSDTRDWIERTWGIDTKYYFFHAWAAMDWYRGYNYTYLMRPWHERDITHAVFCPNNVIGGERIHRVDLFGELDRRGLIDSNIISFPLRCPYEGVSAHELLQSRGYQVRSTLPRVIDRPLNHANHSHAIDFWPQAQPCFVHIVTETAYQGRRLHLTEKTFKPIVMQQPFMLVAPRQSLAYLREYGFQTFGDIWDESYDDLPDEERVAAVAEIAKHIAGWSARERRKRQDQVARKVIYNHDWFYHQLPGRLWRETKNLVDGL